MTAGAPTQPLLRLTAAGAPPGEGPPREEPPEGIPFASALNAQQARTAIAEGHQQEARQQARRAEREAEQAHQEAIPPGGEQAVSQEAAASATVTQTAATTDAATNKGALTQSNSPRGATATRAHDVDGGARPMARPAGDGDVAAQATSPMSVAPAGEPLDGGSAASAAAGSLAAGGAERAERASGGLVSGAFGAAAAAVRGSDELGDGAAPLDAPVPAPGGGTESVAGTSSAPPSAPNPRGGSGRDRALAAALATAATSDPGTTADLTSASPGVRDQGGLATGSSPVQPGASAATQPAANSTPGQRELSTAIESPLGNRARSSFPSGAGEVPGLPLGETQSSALGHRSSVAPALGELRAAGSAQAPDTTVVLDTAQSLDTGRSTGSTAGALHDATRGTDATAGGVAPGVGSVEPGAAFASALGVTADASQGAAPGEDVQAPLLGAEVGLQQALDELGGTIQLATSRGLAQARIALAPAELGEIRIHLTQTADGLLARVTADSPAVAQALAGGHGELRQTLASLGVDLAGVEVGQHQALAAHGGGAAAHHGHDGAAGRGESSPRGARPNTTATEDAAGGAPTEPATATPVAPERRGALVDVLA